MKINPQIAQALEQFNISKEDGVSYLLSVYFDCRPSYTPPILVQKINTTNILGISKDKEILWNIPLFTNEEDSDKWNWVIEWNAQFTHINSTRRVPDKDVIKRMKAYFADNPDVRKEEVIGATKLYIGTVTSATYLISAHYFISKGVGRDRVSTLDAWVAKYRDVFEKTGLTNGKDLSSVFQ